MFFSSITARTWLYMSNTAGALCEVRTAYPLRAPEFTSVGFLIGSLLLIFLVCCIVLLCVFTFCVPCYVSLRSVSRVMCLYVLCSVLWSQLRLQYKNYVRFVFISSCLYDGSCLIYVMCVWLRIVVSNTYCVVFFCYVFLRLVYLMLPVYLDCPFSISPSFI